MCLMKQLGVVAGEHSTGTVRCRSPGKRSLQRWKGPSVSREGTVSEFLDGSGDTGQVSRDTLQGEVEPKAAAGEPSRDRRASLTQVLVLAGGSWGVAPGSGDGPANIVTSAQDWLSSWGETRSSGLD